MDQLSTIDYARELKRGLIRPLIFTQLPPVEIGWTRWFLVMFYARCAAGMLTQLVNLLVGIGLMISGLLQTSIGDGLNAAVGFVGGAAGSQVFLSVVYIIGIFPKFVESTRRAESLRKLVLFTERKILWVEVIGGLFGAHYFLS